MVPCDRFTKIIVLFNRKTTEMGKNYRSKKSQYWGVQQQKRQRTSCDFPGGMIFFVLFCSLFEDILLTKSGKNNKNEQNRTKKIKKDKDHDLFCSFLRTQF